MYITTWTVCRDLNIIKKELFDLFMFYNMIDFRKANIVSV